MSLGNSILITGGTGSFGHKFAKRILDGHPTVERLVIFSRDEMKQWHMAETFAHDKRLRFFVGDVRDKDRLSRAFDGIDTVVHAAATKIVPTAERDPFECIKTNVIGAMNVVDAALDSDVTRLVALSTDKASSPINLYGASKLVSDKIFIASNNYKGKKSKKFSVVRYGNVMGSRGSVIPFFIKTKNNGKILPITHPEMTRFMLTLDEAVDMVEIAFGRMIGGEIFVKKMPSMRLVDVAKTICDKDYKVVGIRPGEKMHEEMISTQDAMTTYDFGDYYVIAPSMLSTSVVNEIVSGGTKVSSGFSYTSDKNPEWMKQETLKDWIENQFFQDTLK
jgi:UDP-N-acetylglucosamine 4,6-dehydratase (inverting)